VVSLFPLQLHQLNLLRTLVEALARPA
jgi:hypothetical protein